MGISDRYAVWKWALLAALIGGSLYVSFPLDQKIRLGLDIKGGTSFTVQVDAKAIKQRILDESPELSDEQVAARIAQETSGAQNRALEVIRNRVDGLGISEPVIYAEKSGRIVVQLPGIDEKKRLEAEESLKKMAFLEFRLVHERNDSLVARLFEKGAPPGYVVWSSGERNYYKRDKKAVRDEDLDRGKVARFNAPVGCELLLDREMVGEQELFTPCFVERRAQLTGEALKKARPSLSNSGQPVVLLEFGAKGSIRFAKITGDYAPHGDKNPSDEGRRLAIVLDGTLYSAPVLTEPIHGGRAEISGRFTRTDAALLANVLQAGSLPAPVEIVEKRIVDPTLGKDAVHSGVKAGIVGCGSIIALMAVYYLACGLIADLALMLNIVLLPLGMILVAGFLGVFSEEARAGGKIALPVLTLPGIAGIALTIGMAVDANVLIFERMREELRAGKGFPAVVQAGFDRAFSAIFDSNLTTFITAMILFVFGSGPVRGYAVTLAGGLIVSLYTAVVVSRMCFTLISRVTESTAMFRMFSIIRATSLDFVGKWKIALVLSSAIIAVSWTMMVARGMSNPGSVFGVDFTGGASLTLSFEKRQGVSDIRAALTAAGVKDPTIQYQQVQESGQEFLQIKVAGEKEGAIVKSAIAERFADAGFKVLREDDVGPQVSAQLKTRAIKAMAFSLIAMVIYISLRFRFGFALGAVAALFHDVLVTAGITHLMGFQINMTVLAALMTIIGYSVNDTIVIFDRIRENLRLVRNKSFVEVCNQSMNETLARTLLTNFLTFISVLFLLALGGESIRDFSAAMFVGMIAGTYSTIYVATPVVLLWYRFKRPDMGSGPVA